MKQYISCVIIKKPTDAFLCSMYIKILHFSLLWGKVQIEWVFIIVNPVLSEFLFQ
jgi:hypothetical protein